MNISKIILTSLLATSALCAMKKDMEQELLEAVKSGNLELSQQLIEQRANVNTRDKYNCTTLLYAAYKGHMDIAQLLIANQADVNAQGAHSDTPLVHASSRGDAHIVQLLIDRQAGVNVQDFYRWTPLIHAAYKGHTDTVRALLHARADLSVQNYTGETALELAKKNNKTEIINMIEQEPRVREETDKLSETALVLCTIRTHEPISILSLIPNELLFLILEHTAFDGYKRLLKRDQE